MKSICYTLILYMILMTPGSGLVACWGDSGHFALEIGSSLDCCPELNRSGISDDLQSLLEGTENADCALCIDIPLSIHTNIKTSLKREKKHLFQIQTSFLPLLHTLRALRGEDRTASELHAFKNILPTCTTLSSIQSVQLLI